MEMNTLLYIGGLGGVEGFLISILLIPAILFLWALIDLLGSNFPDSTNKLIWAIVIIFVPLLGSLLYLILGRRQKSNSLNG